MTKVKSFEDLLESLSKEIYESKSLLKLRARFGWSYSKNMNCLYFFGPEMFNTCIEPKYLKEKHQHPTLTRENLHPFDVGFEVFKKEVFRRAALKNINSSLDLLNKQDLENLQVQLDQRLEK